MASGLGQLLQLRPVAGLQLYVVAPLAESATESPLHIEGAAGAMLTVGVGLTVIVMVVLSLQFAPEEPTIEYTVVTAGLAVTVFPVVALRPVAGLHV